MKGTDPSCMYHRCIEPCKNLVDTKYDVQVDDSSAEVLRHFSSMLYIRYLHAHASSILSSKSGLLQSALEVYSRLWHAC